MDWDLWRALSYDTKPACLTCQTNEPRGNLPLSSWTVHARTRLFKKMLISGVCSCTRYRLLSRRGASLWPSVQDGDDSWLKTSVHEDTLSPIKWARARIVSQTTSACQPIHTNCHYRSSHHTQYLLVVLQLHLIMGTSMSPRKIFFIGFLTITAFKLVVSAYTVKKATCDPDHSLKN
jgi:hypothetical protein